MNYTKEQTEYIVKKYVALPVYKVMPVLLAILFSVISSCLT